MNDFGRAKGQPNFGRNLNNCLTNNRCALAVIGPSGHFCSAFFYQNLICFEEKLHFGKMILVQRKCVAERNSVTLSVYRAPPYMKKFL